MTKVTSLEYTTARGLLERWVYNFSPRYPAGTEANTTLAALKRRRPVIQTRVA